MDLITIIFLISLVGIIGMFGYGIFKPNSFRERGSRLSFTDRQIRKIFFKILRKIVEWGEFLASIRGKDVQRTIKYYIRFIFSRFSTSHRKSDRI